MVGGGGFGGQYSTVIGGSCPAPAPTRLHTNSRYAAEVSPSSVLYKPAESASMRILMGRIGMYGLKTLRPVTFGEVYNPQSS